MTTLTVHPAYKHTYWYAFPPTDACKSEPIVRNRNLVAEYFNLAHWKLPVVVSRSRAHKWICQNCDHVEYYIGDKGDRKTYHIMIHEYRKSKEDIAKYKSAGFERIPPLYLPDVASFDINCQTPNHLVEFISRMLNFEQSPMMEVLPFRFPSHK